nr:winged helix-turn-helix domain-containing protein [Pseudoflavonifractor sp. 60]
MVDGKPLELSRKEFDLLHCLAAYPGQVFSRGQIYSHIWDDEPTVAVDEAVKSLIKKLRKKLATVDKDYIQNMRGVGYKFVLPD